MSCVSCRAANLTRTAGTRFSEEQFEALGASAGQLSSRRRECSDVAKHGASTSQNRTHRIVDMTSAGGRGIQHSYPRPMPFYVSLEGRPESSRQHRSRVAGLPRVPQAPRPLRDPPASATAAPRRLSHHVDDDDRYRNDEPCNQQHAGGDARIATSFLTNSIEVPGT
jgi:hypothetical protein